MAEEAILSDRRLIEFRMAGDANCDPTGVYRNPRATDWSYKGGSGKAVDTRRREGGSSRLPKNSDCDYSIVCASCPAEQRKSSRRVHWWNKELNRHRTRTRRLLNRVMRLDTRIEWGNYREARRSYKKLIRASKR